MTDNPRGFKTRPLAFRRRQLHEADPHNKAKSQGNAPSLLHPTPRVSHDCHRTLLLQESRVLRRQHGTSAGVRRSGSTASRAVPGRRGTTPTNDASRTRVASLADRCAAPTRSTRPSTRHAHVRPTRGHTDPAEGYADGPRTLSTGAPSQQAPTPGLAFKAACRP